MRESGPGFSHRGVLLALRAAAVLVIATGVNDVIAGAVPSYQPLYVYLGAVALVVWLDGVLIGLIAALAATATYALLFMPRAAATSVRILAPLSAMVGAVLLAGVLRAIVRGRRREPPAAKFVPVVATPLLAAPAPPAPDMTEVLDAIDELREELRSAVTRDDARDTEELERARTRERTLSRECADAEARAIRAAREIETMHADLLDRSARVRELETTLENERAGARGTAARVGELQAERQEMRRALDGARTSAGAQTARADRLERELEASRAEVAARDAHWNAASVDATVRAATLEAERTELRRELETARADAANVRHELDRVRLDAAAQASRLSQAAHQIAEARTERDSVRTDASAHVQRVAELEEQAAALRAEIESERVQTSGRVAELEEHAAGLLEELESLRAQVPAREKETVSLREELERARGQALAHEKDAIALREELDGVGARLSQREDEVVALREELDGIRTQSSARIAELDADSLAQNERIAELQAALDVAGKEVAAQLEAGKERGEREFDERLQTIVNHLAADHEADLGKAVEEREVARAESRSLMIRVTSMQRMIEDTRIAAQREIDRLRKRVDDLERGVERPAQRTRVLVAHPDPELRAAARASLERAGYEILSAADGLEALRTAMASQPAVVIADAAMPKMDGRELCQMLKSQEKTAAIRVVLLTRAGEKLPGSDYPADEILHKPVALDALKTTLAQLVAGTRP